MTEDQQQSTQKPRIALYGGAFDPVHRAHLAVARAAQQEAELDEIIFVPSARSPLKEAGPFASDAQRLQMLKLALDGERAFSLDDSEIRLGGMSYTVQTVQTYRSRRPDDELYLMIGADQFRQLDRWYRIEELVRMTRFLVLARPGYTLSAPAIAGLDWIRVEAPLMDVSSTKIRERLSTGQALDDFLPPSVETFIRENGLYT